MQWFFPNKKIASEKDGNVAVQNTLPSGIYIEFQHENHYVAHALGISTERNNELVQHLNEIQRKVEKNLAKGTDITVSHEIEIFAKIANNHAEFAYLMYVYFDK
jgi:uncharacterized alkaline shock family protein YloU